MGSQPFLLTKVKVKKRLKCYYFINMKIDESEIPAFHGWLIKTLTPICDADPAALTRYISALVKKEGSKADSKKVILSMLQVFLSDKTEEFVEVLFKTLSDKSYVNTPEVKEVKEKIVK